MLDLRQIQTSDIRISKLHQLAIVSNNFRVNELTRSSIALRHGIKNYFETNAQAQAAVNLTRTVLQPVRDEFGAYRPNSVYRSQDLERRLKNKSDSWVSSSQHTLGEAGDIEIPGIDNLELAEWIEKHLEFDQLILEFYDPNEGPNSGWVHVSKSFIRPNRNIVLTYRKIEGKFIYQRGLSK